MTEASCPQHGSGPETGFWKVAGRSKMSVWGTVARQTRAGVLGPEHAIDVTTAIRLYTVDAARLIGERSTRDARAGPFGGWVAYGLDPMSIPVDELRSLRPAFTMVGGHTIPTGAREQGRRFG